MVVLNRDRVALLLDNKMEIKESFARTLQLAPLERLHLQICFSIVDARLAARVAFLLFGLVSILGGIFTGQ